VSINKYFATSIFLLSFFILIALMVSPKLLNGNTNDSHFLKTDASLFLFINKFHSDYSFNQFMIWMTQYGRELVWSITIILLLIFGSTVGKKVAIVMGLSMIVLIPIVAVAKDIVARPRPIVPKADFLISSDSEYSFPSGHTTIVCCGAILMLLLYRGSRIKLVISLVLAIEAAIVSFSRVYVGSHYPLDVVGGILLGVGISLIFVWRIRFIEESIILPISRILSVKLRFSRD
jgi:membrane-associated phospholipid phosphatase